MEKAEKEAQAKAKKDTEDKAKADEEERLRKKAEKEAQAKTKADEAERLKKRLQEEAEAKVQKDTEDQAKAEEEERLKKKTADDQAATEQRAVADKRAANEQAKLKKAVEAVVIIADVMKDSTKEAEKERGVKNKSKAPVKSAEQLHEVAISEAMQENQRLNAEIKRYKDIIILQKMAALESTEPLIMDETLPEIDLFAPADNDEPIRSSSTEKLVTEKPAEIPRPFRKPVQSTDKLKNPRRRRLSNQ